MRKTVDEWLGTHQQGRGMAKKSQVGKQRPAGPPALPPKIKKRKQKPAKRKPK